MTLSMMSRSEETSVQRHGQNRQPRPLAPTVEYMYMYMYIYLYLYLYIFIYLFRHP